MPPRRVLVVTDEMEVGGSQRQITYLLMGLDPAKWHSSLAYFRNHSFLVDALAERSIDIHYMPKRRRLDPGFMMRYIAHVRKGDYDVVHAFSLTAELYTAIACLLMRSPPRLITSIRGMYLLLPGWFWFLKRWILGRSDAVIANARAGIDAAISRTSMMEAKFDLVPNGVVMPEPLAKEQRDALRSALGVPPGRRLALFVGRMVHQKNPSCLVRAIHRLPAAQRPWVVMVGDGPLRQETEAMVSASGMEDDFSFIGEREDTIQLMQASDFLVLPSLHEGMPNVVLEAMSAGCPVIASDAGGTPELIEHGETGLIFRNDDDSALAACMDRMVRECEMRIDLARKAHVLALEKFSVAAMVAATERIYERSLHGRTPRYGYSSPVGTESVRDAGRPR